jgi:hypothetical protein
MLPARLKRPKLGVQVPPRKIWPRHRRWVKSHGCCVPGCDATIVDFAHLRSCANAGVGQKPHDIFGVSLCRAHHDEQHRLGVDAFDRKYGIDLWALAAEFVRRSPDGEMRATLKLVRVEELAAPDPAQSPLTAPG